MQLFGDFNTLISIGIYFTRETVNNIYCLHWSRIPTSTFFISAYLCMYPLLRFGASINLEKSSPAESNPAEFVKMRQRETHLFCTEVSNTIIMLQVSRLAECREAERLICAVFHRV
jgi:hypothetical protein